MQTEAGLGFNISGGEGAGEGKGILVDHMGSAIRVSMVFVYAICWWSYNVCHNL